jgi:uncharacterized protein YdhG (YjbR/CyaY superfamily)
MATFDEYLAEQADDSVIRTLAHIREVVTETAVDAQEGTSYGMPAWRVGGKPLLGVNVAKAHIGVFPFSPDVVDAVRDRLAGFDVTKGGVKCTPDRPVPDLVLVEMIRLRREEIMGMD